MLVRCPVLLALLCLLAVPAIADPFSTDPDPTEPPPSMASVRIPSGDALLNGIVYLPGGPGPHPVALLLHGLPGDERNLDLAHVLRRDGWAVVFFHYRGAWGSPGNFGFANVLEDVAAVVEWTLETETLERFRLNDAARTLVGHSMGGFAALTAGSEHDDVGCIASLSGANMSLVARALEGDEPLRDTFVQSFDGLVEGPLAGTSGEALVAELEANVEAWDLEQRVSDLLAHRVLLVAGTKDRVAPPERHHDPLLAALVRAESDVVSVVLEDDHAYSGSRVALAREVTNWLARGCR